MTARRISNASVERLIVRSGRSLEERLDEERHVSAGWTPCPAEAWWTRQPWRTEMVGVFYSKPACPVEQREDSRFIASRRAD